MISFFIFKLITTLLYTFQRDTVDVLRGIFAFFTVIESFVVVAVVSINCKTIVAYIKEWLKK